MSKKSSKALVALAVVLVVFSVIAFAVPFEKNSVFWVAYICGIVAILAQIYVFKISFSGENAKSRFYGFPIAKIGITYLAVQGILSIVEMALAKVMPLRCALVVNVIVAGVCLIGCIAAETMREEIVKQDDKLKNNVSMMRNLQSMANSLVGLTSDSELKKELQKVSDELKYSDPVSMESTREAEANIKQLLGDIQSAVVDGDNEGVKALCKKLSVSLAERNRVCKLSKGM